MKKDAKMKHAEEEEEGEDEAGSGGRAEIATKRAPTNNTFSKDRHGSYEPDRNEPVDITT